MVNLSLRIQPSSSAYGRGASKEISFLQEKFAKPCASMTTRRIAAAGAASDHDGMEKALTMFQPISHPVLHSVEPVKVSQFLRDRERYEIEVREKKKEVPTMTAATYRVSVDPGMLRRMHFLGKFKSIAPDTAVSALTSAHIETWVKGMVRKDDMSYNRATIEKALSSLRVPMSIADPEARIMEYCNDFFTRLEWIGYEDFNTENPKKTVLLLQERLFPKTLKNVMQHALEYQEALQKDVVAYVQVLCAEARACEKYKNKDGTATERSPMEEKTGKLLVALRDTKVEKNLNWVVNAQTTRGYLFSTDRYVSIQVVREMFGGTM